eukprot:NODE_19_length_39463_cov_0.396073.p10 type:complete len:390 gc:universal NODE_19_length_39463_cov_0.396073:26115-24946(-)
MTLQYQLYRDLQNNKNETVLMSKENTHSAPQIQHQKHDISNNLGWRTAKGNCGLHLGSWYYEITLKAGDCRVGYAQISADLQAYPGYDCFGYGFGNCGGLYHQAISRKSFDSRVGFKVGDVVGMLIVLPNGYSEDEEAILESRKWDPLENYQPLAVNEKEVEIWKRESKIVYYLNGKEILGFPYLFLGRFYPAVGLWKDSKVHVNMGPNFKYPIPKNAKPYSDARGAPLCIGRAYNSEDIAKIHLERVEEARIAAELKTPDAEDDLSSNEKLLKTGELLYSPIDNPISAIAVRTSGNSLRRKGLGTDKSPKPKTPEIKAHSAPYIYSPSRKQSPRAMRPDLEVEMTPIKLNEVGDMKILNESVDALEDIQTDDAGNTESSSVSAINKSQ